MRARGAMAAVVAVLTGMALLSPPAAVAQAADGVTLAATHSGLCLTIPGGSTAASVQARQDRCGRVAGQEVVMESVGSGIVRLRLTHSQRCLAVSGTATPVSQQTCGTTSAQRWTVQAAEVGGVHLVNGSSGRCLDVNGASTAVGEPLIQWTCHQGPNQAFHAVSTDPAVSGRWGDVIPLPNIAVAMAALPTGKVLLWSSDQRTTFNTGRGRTWTSVFDPATETATDVLVEQTNHDMFCPGIAMLADGRVMVNGGGQNGSPGRRATSIYDPFTEEWTADARMTRERWYNASLTLPDGDVLTMGGAGTHTLEGGPVDRPERWDPETGWDDLTTARTEVLRDDTSQGDNRSGEHPRLYVRSDGQVAYTGPSRTLGVIDVEGEGAITAVGPRGDDEMSQIDVQAMFGPDLVLTAGGSTGYGSSTPATRGAHVVDLSTGVTTPTGPMAFRRANGNTVALPTGEVMALGGIPHGENFSDRQAVLHAEAWDPGTGAWTTWAAMQVPRTYHSSAVLLPDGRVLAAGGGLCGSCGVNHPDGEIFSPPYLFRGARPTITAPDQILYGGTFDVATSGDVARFTMVRMSAATHSTNNDQRVLPVAATSRGGGGWQLEAPANANLAPPGYYMVFAVSSDDVPSVAGVTRLMGDPFPPPPPSDGLEGSPDGDLAVDAVADGDRVTGLTIRHGAWIDGVQLHTSAGDAPLRGGDGGQATRIDLSGGDAVVELRGTHDGTHIRSLEVRTARGLTHGPYGIPGDTSFAFTAPDGEGLVGLQTRAARYLHAVGASFAAVDLPSASPEPNGGPGGRAFADEVVGEASLTGITIRHGAWIDAVQLHTTDGDLPRRGGAGGQATRIDIAPDDPLVELFGTHDGRHVRSIGVRTAAGATFGPYGTTGPEAFSVLAPPGEVLSGLVGRSGDYLDALSALSQPGGTTGTATVVGGPQGVPFTDIPGEPITGVTVRHGAWIDAIQLHTAADDRPVHGGTGGTPTTWTLAPGERIVGVTGSHDGIHIHQLVLETSTGRTLGPVGTPAASAFELTVPEGSVLTGVRGRARYHLNAIGLVTGPA